MKYIKRILLPLILLMLMLCSASVCMAAGKNYEAAEKKYNKFINSHSLGGHVIVDVDGNGIPELICYNKKDNKNYLYTYVKSTKKMKKLGSVNSGKAYGSYYSTKKHQVALTSSDTGGARYYVYEVKGTKVAKKTIYKSQRNYKNYTYTYYKDGKKISSKTFDKAVNAIRKWKYVAGIF